MNIIYVVGINGKGFVCFFVFNILRECGYKVGLYIFLYLEIFIECIRVNG